MQFTGERLIPKDKKCGPETEIYKEHFARYEFSCKFLESSFTVLDIACGVGYGTEMMASKCSKVYGCDIDKETIDYARKNYSNTNITFQMMDASSLLFQDNFFDCITCFETMEHLKDHKKTLEEFSRVLKQNGKLIISTPNKEISLKHNTHNQFHTNEFTKKEFLEILSINFSKIDLFSQKLIVNPTIKEKILKSGLSFGFKLSQYDRLQLRHKLFKKGTGQKIYQSIDESYQSPDILSYRNEHIPQNFVAVCFNRK